MLNFFKKIFMTEDTQNADGSVTHVVTEQDHAEGKFTEVAVGESTTFIPTGPARLYEIQDKVTAEIFPVEQMGSADVDHDGNNDLLVKKEDGTEVVFKCEGSNEDGVVFSNEQFTIRDRETKLAPNGVTLVADVVPAEVKEVDAPSFAKFNVFDANGAFVRCYSSEDHGDKAQELAEQFATKIAGSVQ